MATKWLVILYSHFADTPRVAKQRAPLRGAVWNYSTGSVSACSKLRGPGLPAFGAGRLRRPPPSGRPRYIPGARLQHAKMSNATVRRVCFTWNNPDDLDYVICCEFIKKYCKYGIVGKEVAPTTGTKHLQGFCNFSKPMRFSTIKKRLNNGIHLEKANGSDEQNQKYCSKSGVFFEEGHPQRQGKRNDLDAVIHTIQSGKITTLTEVALLHASSFIKYHRGIQTYLRLSLPITPRAFKTEVYFYWGPPGTGKSRRAAEEARARYPDKELSVVGSTRSMVYYKPRGLWWDGYEQHEAVIIDDFYGWIKYDEMLKICDRYPYQVQIKGGFQEFTTKSIWITSNVSIDELYKFPGYDSAALQRRMTCIDYMD